MTVIIHSQTFIWPLALSALEVDEHVNKSSKYDESLWVGSKWMLGRNGWVGLRLHLVNLYRVYLILGLCECRVCYFLKPKPFGNWGKWSSFCLFAF